MPELNEIVILFNGYSKDDVEDPNHGTHANCTCTLIKGCEGYNVIVDTMTPWDGQRILEALGSHSLRPEDINAVVSTHGHSDHTGNNNLFLNADWHIVGQCISNRDKYLLQTPTKESPFRLTRDIQVVVTPGHTLSCVSVIVSNTNLGKEVAICGDLFEKQEDIDEPTLWIDVGSENKALQAENRLKRIESADWIVPGHGPAFQVTQEMREKLRHQLKNT